MASRASQNSSRRLHRAERRQQLSELKSTVLNLVDRDDRFADSLRVFVEEYQQTVAAEKEEAGKAAAAKAPEHAPAVEADAVKAVAEEAPAIELEAVAEEAAAVEAEIEPTEQPAEEQPAVEKAPADTAAVVSQPEPAAAGFEPTEEQKAGQRAAAAHIQSVVEEAEAAPQSLKEQVGSEWNYQDGGPRLVKLLKNTHLIDAKYLIILYEAGGVLPRWQEIPKAAKIDKDNCWRLRYAWGGTGSDFRLPVLFLTYCWYNPYHPCAAAGPPTPVPWPARAKCSRAHHALSLATPSCVGSVIPSRSSSVASCPYSRSCSSL